VISLAPLLAAPFELHAFTVVPASFPGSWLIYVSRKEAPPQGA
jgi:hypothetical protein